jgi:4-amino-4-deoxy-L-arabinose transferase-like glycosyltransferase
MPVTTSRQLGLILLVAALAFFTRLGAAKLWDRDEPRNARCAWEMLERNDWVVPSFNGELRAHKPILLYWLTMSAYTVFGINEFAARFWSAGLSLGTTLLTYAIGRRLFGPGSGCWAAIVLSTTLMFNVAAHAATPDATLIFCCTLSLGLLVAGVDARAWTAAVPLDATASTYLRTSGRTALLSGSVMGLGLLAKGPIGLLLPMAIWTLFLWWAGGAGTTRLRPRYLWQTLFVQLRPLTICVAAIAVAAPWYLLVGLRTDGAWLREFFWEHNVGRAMRPMEGHTGGLLWFYPLALLVGTFPWSAWAIPLVLWIRRQRGALGFPPPYVFLFCWVGVFVGFFSCASTKLPSYITPAYPAVAIVCGHFLHAWPKTLVGIAFWWPRWSAATLIVVGVMLSAGLLIAAQLFLPGEEWLAAIGLVPLLGGAFCLERYWRRQFATGHLVMAAAALLLILGTFAGIAPRVSRHQRIDELISRAVGHELGSRASIASFGSHEPSWVFYAGRTIPHLDAGDFAGALNVLRAPDQWLITTATQYEAHAADWPADIAVRDWVPYFLRDEKLVLLGRDPRLGSAGRSAPPRR